MAPSVIVQAGNGPIPLWNMSSAQSVFVTKSKAAQLFLRPPMKSEDGKKLRIISTTSARHVVRSPASSVLPSSGKKHGHATLTFGGHVADNVHLEAFNGAWYVFGSRNVTIGHVGVSPQVTPGHKKPHGKPPSKK